ncbi:MAG: retron system putative HNH endonuclease [Saprospiraceae bacterium]
MKKSLLLYIIYYKPRVDAFERNKIAGKYTSSDNLYKPKKVKESLDKIYHKKCAYCEKSLKDADRHVEHYRPKVPYFWLAFSWDNLLIACKRCNEFKSNYFVEYLEGTVLEYNNETLQTAQSQIIFYNKKEKPLILNPEQETEESLKSHFTFDLKTAELIPLSPQMKATIKVCRLNREELVEKRKSELTRLKGHLEQDVFAYRGNHKKVERGKAMLNTFKKFRTEISEETSFLAWRNFILKNWRTIVTNNVQL